MILKVEGMSMRNSMFDMLIRMALMRQGVGYRTTYIPEYSRAYKRREERLKNRNPTFVSLRKVRVRLTSGEFPADVLEENKKTAVIRLMSNGARIKIKLNKIVGPYVEVKDVRPEGQSQT